MKNKEIMQTGLYLYLIRPNHENGYKLISNITITKDRYVYSDKFEIRPIEDCGDYLLSDNPVNNPLEEYLTLL